MRRLMNSRYAFWTAGLFCCSLLQGGRVAAAEPETQAIEVSADTFRPALDASGLLDVESGALSGHLDADLGFFTSYLLNPLVLRESGGARSSVGALVAHRWNAHLVGAVGLLEWVQLGLDLPLVVLQSAETLQASDVGRIAVQPLASTGLGDLRLRPKFRILTRSSVGVDVAFMSTITLPTHFPAGGYLGEAGFGIAPELAVSSAFGGLVWATNLAAHFRDDAKTQSLGVSHEWIWRGGVGYLFESLRLRTDMSLRASTSLQNPFSEGLPSPLEATAGVRWEPVDGLFLQSGLGLGLITGPGTPDARLFVALRYAPRVRDTDGDGVLDAQDACIDTPEDVDGFQDGDGCPELDNDSDGIQDPDDQCADEAEDLDAFQDEDGCPDPDNDEDGILDADDQCPLEQGVAQHKGCALPDTDGDGVPDATDACPKVAGQVDAKGCPDADNDGFLDDKDFCPDKAETKNAVADSDGCPDTAQSKWVLSRDEIQLLEMPEFEFKSEELLGPTIDLLNQIAELLVQHPEIAKIQLEVHTDELRTADDNEELSAARANAMMIHLATAGVSIERLDSVATGAQRPRSRRGKRIQREADRLFKIRIVKWDTDKK